MNVKSPLGANYGWVVHQDHRYVAREIEEDIHGQLAVFSVISDPELVKIEKTLGYPVVLAVRVGKYTLHLRIYKRHDVETRPDWLPSRMATRDPAAFMVFNEHGGLELIEGNLRERAQGHSPAFYAERSLSPHRQAQLDVMERQLMSTSGRKLSVAKPDGPFHSDPVMREITKPDLSTHDSTYAHSR